MKKESILQRTKEDVGVSNHILQVGVIGSSGEEEYLKTWKPPKGMIKTAKEVGKLLGEKGATIVTGGGGGIMSSVASEGIKRNSITIGILNTFSEVGLREVYTVELPTGMFEGGPEYFLPLYSDIIIAISGGAGTLDELTVAYRNCIPVVLLKGYGGWVDKLIPQLYQGKYLDERKRVQFYVANTPEEAVKIAIREGLKRLKKIVKIGKEISKKHTKLRSGLRNIF